MSPLRLFFFLLEFGVPAASLSSRYRLGEVSMLDSKPRHTTRLLPLFILSAGTFVAVAASSTPAADSEVLSARESTGLRSEGRGQVSPKSQAQVIYLMKGQPHRSFMYFSRDVNVLHGNQSDLDSAYRAYAKDDNFAWYRDGAHAWLIRDPVYLNRIRDAFAGVSAPDVSATSLQKQEVLNHRMAELNERMARLSAERVAMDRSDSTKVRSQVQAAVVNGRRSVDEEQAEVSREMSVIAKQQAEEGARQAERGHRQAQDSERAVAMAESILAEAVRNHAAQPSR